MNVLTAIEAKGITMKRVSGANGGEYAGPCPVCGGDDRFHAWPEKDKGGKFWCRGCNKSGDLIEIYRWAFGMSYPEACQAAGREPQKYTYNNPRLPAVSDQAPFTPPVYDPPSSAWQEHARKFIDACHATLIDNPPACRWLMDKRGLNDASVRGYRLGLNWDDAYRARSAWGLVESVSEKTGKPKKLWLPRGLVIPTWGGGDALMRVRIRRTKADVEGSPSGFGPRYYFLPGSSPAMMSLKGVDRRAYVVVEAELDAMLIAQEAGDLVGVVALGTSSAKPDAEVYAQLIGADVILVALDADAAGAAASGWWLQRFRQAQRWPVPAGKDPGEIYRDVDVRSWVLAGLPQAWHVPVGPSLQGKVLGGGDQQIDAGDGPADADGDQAAQRLPDGVREVGHILRHHQVRIIATDARMAVVWREGCEVPDVALRLSRLVFGDPDCIDYLLQHPAQAIDGRNFNMDLMEPQKRGQHET